MRSAEEILRHIESLQLYMLDRPPMYSATPESFEGVLFLLERLRAFILDAEEKWSDYLVDNGFGVATISMRLAERGVNDPKVQFAETARRFREFLGEQGRCSRSSEIPMKDE